MSVADASARVSMTHSRPPYDITGMSWKLCDECEESFPKREFTDGLCRTCYNDKYGAVACGGTCGEFFAKDDLLQPDENSIVDAKGDGVYACICCARKDKVARLKSGERRCVVCKKFFPGSKLTRDPEEECERCTECHANFADNNVAAAPNAARSAVDDDDDDEDVPVTQLGSFASRVKRRAILTTIQSRPSSPIDTTGDEAWEANASLAATTLAAATSAAATDGAPKRVAFSRSTKTASDASDATEATVELGPNGVALTTPAPEAGANNAPLVSRSSTRAVKATKATSDAARKSILKRKGAGAADETMAASAGAATTTASKKAKRAHIAPKSN